MVTFEKKSLTICDSLLELSNKWVKYNYHFSEKLISTGKVFLPVTNNVTICEFVWFIAYLCFFFLSFSEPSYPPHLHHTIACVQGLCINAQLCFLYVNEIQNNVVVGRYLLQRIIFFFFFFIKVPIHVIYFPSKTSRYKISNWLDLWWDLKMWCGSG